MNIIIPIAGGDVDLSRAGYIKSLQEIERKMVLQYSIESLRSVCADRFVVVVRRCDVNAYHLDYIVRLLRSEAEIVVAEGETMGAACTCMLAVDCIEQGEPLLIVGGDQILTLPAQEIIDDFMERDLDGGMAIFDDIHPRWSYVRLDENDRVIEAAEKHPISRNAVAGFYYFKKAAFFFDAAQRMIMKNACVNDAFFICPVYNEMILKQLDVGVRRIEKAQYYNFGHASGMEAFRSYLKEQRKTQ